MFPIGDVCLVTEIPKRTDDGEEAVPYMKSINRRDEILESWQKLSRKQIAEELMGAQSMNDGLVICAGCGRQLEPEFMELDHIMPRSDRGVNDISNRILLCRPCNGRKSNTLTMAGLFKENRKTRWMRNEKLAIKARELAKRRYEELRNETDT